MEFLNSSIKLMINKLVIQCTKDVLFSFKYINIFLSHHELSQFFYVGVLEGLDA